MTTIRISDPIDLVKVVPYHMGFHPTRSVVLMGLHRKQLGLIQRLDLPAPADAGAAAELLVDNLRREQCTGVVLVVYEQDSGEGDAVADAVLVRLRPARITLIEHLVVRAGQVHFAGCTHEIACASVPLPADDAVPAVAEYVALGRRPVADRAALEALLAPEEGPLRARVGAALQRRGALSPLVANRPLALAEWGRFLDVADASWFGSWQPTAAAMARMLHALRDVMVRDLIASWLSPGGLGPQDFDGELVALARASFPPDSPGWNVDSRGSAELERDARLRERLCWLARHTPDGSGAAMLALIGTVAWHHGEGALASIAVERALALDPGYRLALLLERALEVGLRPPAADTAAIRERRARRPRRAPRPRRAAG